MTRFALPLRALLLALLTGCDGDALPAATKVPEPVAPVAEPPAPAPAYWVSPPEPTTVPVPRGPVLPEEVDAYLADCGHAFAAMGEVSDRSSLDDILAGERLGTPEPGNSGEQIELGPDECTWRQFHQNCSPDVFGCWEKGESCALRANVPCLDCQTSCTASCESCKAACAGKESCLRRCAETRGECRNGCTDARKAWQEKTCPDAKGSCRQRVTDAVKTECAGCTELLSCVAGPQVSIGEGDAIGECKSRHPQVTENCWNVCYQALWTGHLKPPPP